MYDFMYEWMENEDSFCVFDDMGEPILEALEFLQSERNRKDSLNSQEGKAVALRFWFEFLNQEGVHCFNAENKHIPLFRDWLKTPPKYRDIYKRGMHQEEHISSSTWMQYQARVAMFYERYVLLKNPECKINWKEEASRIGQNKKNTHEYRFKERIKIIAPDTRSIEPEIFKKIRAQATNKRNALIFDLLYVSGIRRGELLNVDCRQFDNIDRTKSYFKMIIHDSFGERKDNQTKTGGRSVYIPSSVAEKIASYVLHDRVVGQCDHHIIFTANRDVQSTKAGDPLTGKYISKLFKDAAIKAGYPKYTIHDCRHSMITNTLSMGADLKTVMDQAGHKSFNTTMNYRSRQKEVPFFINEYCGNISNAIKEYQ